MNASSESGECASLISTGSFSVFEAVCWPDMGLSVPIPVRLRRGRVIPRTASKRLPGPGAGSSQRDFPTEEGSIGDERKKLARRRGLRGARPGDFLQEKPSISVSGEQLERDKQGKRISGIQALQRGDHACDRVVERSSAVQVRLPEFLKQPEVVVPPTLIQAFAQGIGSVTAAGHTTILVASGRPRSTKHRTYDFARSVENESLPEVARDSFVALVALTNDGGLHGFGNTMRTFVEKNFESRRALIARVEAGDGDTQGVGGRVGARPVGMTRQINADFCAWPAGLVNVRKPFRQAHALFTHERRDTHDPAAVGSVMLWPKMRAVNRRCRFQDLRQLWRQARVAEFSLPAGEFIAILEISELVFQLDQLGGKEQILGRIIRGIVSDGLVPDALIRGRERRFCTWRSVQSRARGFAAFVRRTGGSQLRVMIERVMKIDPEATVKLEYRKRSVGVIALRLACRSTWEEYRKSEQKKKPSRCDFVRHCESHDSSAKSCTAQTSRKCRSE